MYVGEACGCGLWQNFHIGVFIVGVFQFEDVAYGCRLQLALTFSWGSNFAAS